MNLIGLTSYSLGAVAFFLLALVLLTVWRGRLGTLFAVAVAGTAAWLSLLAFHAYDDVVPSAVLFASELAHNVLWLVFLVSLMSGTRSRRLPGRLRWFVHALWVTVLVAGLVSLSVSGQWMLSVFLFSSFVVSVVGLVITEQVYRNTLEDPRWAIKFLCLALAGVFVFDLVLYAKALMFRGIDLDLWNARGAVHLLVAPLIALTAARSPKWTPDLFLSRQMAFYTTSVFGAGLYLLAMAAGGYYVRIWGGEWGTVAQATFVFGAVLLLLVMFFSGQVRARVKVFLNKHFFHYKYDYREEWLRLTRLLSSSKDPVPLRDRAIISLAKPVESPGGALWWRREDGDCELAASWNMRVPAASAVSASDPLGEFLQRRKWVVDLVEWRRDQGIYGPLQIPRWLQEMDSAWLVVPLMKEDQLHGFVVLAQSRAPQKLTWEDLDLLKTVGRQVAGYLALEDAAALLAEASQFQAFNRFTAFIMHDLKNLIAQQSLVVKNAARHKNNPEFIEDAINTVDNSVRRMSRLLEQLQQGESQGRAGRLELNEVCQEVIEQWGARGTMPVLESEPEGIAVRASRERMVAVLGHIVRNAQDAVGKEGEVRIRTARRDGFAIVEVSDTGPGMDEEFIRERLFRPFVSTKGSKGMGIGAYQAREFARALGGDVEVSSIIGQGTQFRLILPEDANPAVDSRSGVMS